MATAATKALTIPTSVTDTGGIGVVTGTDDNLTKVTFPTRAGGVWVQCKVANGKVQYQGVAQGAAPNAAAFDVVAGTEPFLVLAEDLAPPVTGTLQFGVAGNTTEWHFSVAQIDARRGLATP